MARRKKFLRIRLPFINFRVKKDTFLNVIGIFIWTVALILFLSFFIPGGELLFVVSTELTTLLGGFAIIFPFLLALAGTHFFNSHRLQLVKLHVTIGLTFMFIAFLGVFRSGFFGQAIYESLVADFSIFGAIIILFVMFIVGIVLFFNTSVDAFLAIVMELFKFVYSFIQKKFLAQDKEEKLLKGPAGEFITDRKAVPQQTSLVHANKHDEGDLKMKPYKTTSNGKWEYPPLTILADISNKKADVGDIKENSAIIERTLDSFGIRARVVDVNDGPTVTQYALEIVMGTKLSKITALANDLALALAAPTGQVRIEAPIPGRALVGIEIPNRKAELVPLKKLLAMGTFRKSDKALWVPLGLDVTGKAQGLDITNMPHVLIAGTTGAGKSVLLNSWICTMLFRASPEEVRLILIDPKRVELSLYNGIPHLMTEVIVEPKKIISALQWTVGEMENRYKQFAKVGVRNIQGYNAEQGVDQIPYIVFVIDELADLMVFAPGDAEELITRIAQMARATGIHLILATQRPSVDVITGLMKANIPARVAFNVASMVDSRVVLDMPGAEKLLGKGDMLFIPPDQAKPRRIQGPYLTEKDVVSVVNYLKKKVPEVHYTDEVTAQDVQVKGRGGRVTTTGEHDQLFDDALKVIYEQGNASASYLQRRLSIGYARAARILDQLEAAGYVGASQGPKPREILTRPQEQD